MHLLPPEVPVRFLSLDENLPSLPSSSPDLDSGQLQPAHGIELKRPDLRASEPRLFDLDPDTPVFPQGDAGHQALEGRQPDRSRGPFPASGRSEEELKFTGDVDVSWAIRELVEEHGEAFKEALLDPITQSPTTNTLILLNGVEINNIKGVDTTLDDGDHIVLIPVTHGG